MFRCRDCGALNRVPERVPAGSPVCGKCKRALDTSGEPQAVDAAGFASAVRSSPVPVLVDFWAPWCGPCRAAAPMLDALAKSRAGKLLVLKVNTDEQPEVASRFGIRGIPTFVLFANGQEVGRQSGIVPTHQIDDWIAEAGHGARA
jgi:thioredoxin 2